MRPVPRAALLLAALALPLAAALAGSVGFPVTGGEREPRVPASVEVGSSPAPPEPPALAPRSSQLPPPPPDEDDEDDEHPHYDHDG